MRLALGCLLGAGVLLLASPLLWPRQHSEQGRNRGRLHERLVQAGLGHVSVPVFAAVSAIVALASATLAFALLGVVPLAVSAGVGGAVLPSLLVGWRAQSRRRSQRTVWPDVVDHLVAAVRSGLALPDSVSSLAHAGPVSTRAAFTAFDREYRATGSFSVALDRLKEDLADPVADRILETLRMAREVGGSDLTVVLRNLAAWLRQETAIRQEVEARQSWIMNAARLGVAAPWVLLLLLASRREAAVAYNTTGGLAVILGGLVASVIAYRMMIALGRLPEERRWFA
ncbi:type II secretion system F family protein [Cryobacterium tepidiphilum]|uniref:Type II secretion system protein F n=1 Tax=Cryobacterium tepidiphilum TaxID=2486026 RepID=A0A3M8L313_9MICO|nr:type II secretion system F family protein [Cryobacterium tepidiphilum]RNE59024.1 type II secretion system protein F [Cryobacterium tepidiphilum]